MDSKSFKIHSKGTSSSFPGICWICHQSDTPISKQNFRFPNFFFQSEMTQKGTEIIQKIMISNLIACNKEKVRKNWSEDDKKVLIWIIGKLSAYK